MRLSTAPLFAALFAAASVRAQDADANCTSAALSSIPACALPCFVHGAATIGCGGLDVACLCRQQAALLAAVEPCMATSCNDTELQDALDAAEAGAQPHNRLLLGERETSTLTHAQSARAPTRTPKLPPPLGPRRRLRRCRRPWDRRQHYPRRRHRAARHTLRRPLWSSAARPDQGQIWVLSWVPSLLLCCCRWRGLVCCVLLDRVRNGMGGVCGRWCWAETEGRARKRAYQAHRRC